MQNTLEIEEAKRSKGRWAVSYLGKIRRNPNPNSPSDFLIQVFGVRVKADCVASMRSALFRYDHSFFTSVGNIPRFTVGSIWENGRKIGNIEPPPVTFSIEPQPNQIVNYSGALGGHISKDYIFNFREWPNLQYGNRDLKFCILNSQSESGRSVRLIIPCVEIVRFFFGFSSSFLKLVFCVDPANERYRIYSPELSGWHIKSQEYHIYIGPRVLHEDGKNIARIVVNDRLRKTLKVISDSLHRSNIDEDSRSFYCWFPIDVICSLSVLGYPCRSKSGTEQFFVQRIHDCVYPQQGFKTIVFPSNDNRKATLAEELRPAWSGASIIAPPELTKIVNLNSTSTASNRCAPAKLRNSDYENPWLTEPAFTARLCDKKAQKTQAGLAQVPSGAKQNYSSSTDQSSLGKTTALIQSGHFGLGSTNFDSEDETGKRFALVIQKLSKIGFSITPERIGTHYSENGYYSEFFDSNDSKWFHMPNLHPPRNRRLYVVRLTTSFKGMTFIGYLFEIETRSQESFSLTMVFNESHLAIPIHTLERIVSSLGKACGKWRNTLLEGGLYKHPFEHPNVYEGTLLQNPDQGDEQYAEKQAAKISKKVAKIIRSAF